MSLDLDVAGHPRWLALSLDGDVDRAAEAYADEVCSPEVEAEVREQTVAVVAGMSRLARSAADDGPPTAMAWSLLPPDRLPAPGPVALLRYVPFRPEGSDDDAVELVLDPAEERWGDLDVDLLDGTPHRAVALRYRPVQVRDGVREVHERRAVVWPVPSLGLALLLSVTVVDLLAGPDLDGPFAELARGLRWSAA